MAKKSRKISRLVKQKFSPGFFYLVFSLIILILITFFINTSKISKEPKAAESAYVFASNGVSCGKTYPSRAYAFCDRTCGQTKLSFKGLVKTYSTEVACGTYTVRPNIFPNYSPLDKNFISKVLSRPKTVITSYCCVSK